MASTDLDASHLLITRVVKILLLMTAATLFALSAARAQDPSGPVSSQDADSGTDASVLPPVPAAPDGPSLAAPTTPAEAGAMEDSLYGAEDAENQAGAEPDAQSRSWNVNFHGAVDSRYDDNIFITPTHESHDVLTNLIAGAGLTLGDYTTKQNNYLVSDYTGIGEFFGHYSAQNAYEQKASLAGQLLFGHVTVKADFSFEDLAEENIDIGARARSQFYLGHASARYDISDKTYLEATAEITVSDYDLYLNSNDERGGVAFGYRPDPSVTMGMGATAGVLHVEASPSQTYQEILASAQVDLTDKLTATASGGWETRQTAVNASLDTPVLDLTADYKPIEGLDLSLSAYRRIENSAYFAGSDFISTGVSAAAQYALSARFTLMLSGGYVNCDYQDVTSAGDVSRTDNYSFVRPGFRYIASPYWNLELYYIYRKNQSTLSNYSFTDTQVGADVNITY